MSEGVELKMYANKSDALYDMLDEARKELAELRADAERYRYLKKSYEVSYDNSWFVCQVPVRDGVGLNIGIDETIDHYLELEKKTNGGPANDRSSL